MIRSLLMGFALAGSLGGAALIATPASAAPLGSAAAPIAQSGQGLLQDVQYYYGRPRYYRPRPYYRPRCFWSERRVWNGWRWVVRPVRVCR
jgi:hypothetical protein